MLVSDFAKEKLKKQKCMELEEPIYYGKGLLEQIKEVSPICADDLDLSVSVENIYRLLLLGGDISEEREYKLYFGGTLYYGRGCKTLNQVHYAKIRAIKQAKFIGKIFGIKQRICFYYAPDQRINQPWRKCRGKNHQR